MSCEASSDPGMWDDVLLGMGIMPDPDVWEEDSDDDSLTPVSDEDWERYKKQVEESDGFDVDLIPGVGDIPEVIAPVERKKHGHYVPFLMSAIKEHNLIRKAVQGRKIEFKKIIKITATHYPFCSFYYTFEGRDVPVRGTPGRIRTRTYQAQLELIHGRYDLTFVIFRRKASPGV